MDESADARGVSGNDTDETSRFPNPAAAPGDAPLAVGGDLSSETLLDAYRHGIFPWPSGDARDPIVWWSPDPRCIFEGAMVHASRSLQRRMRTTTMSVSTDRAFDAVVAACARRPGEGTWITTDMAEAYGRLHRLGHAHSVEVWSAEGELVGGIYGVAVGAVFSGESMFHRITDASKIALVALGDHLQRRGFRMLDAQMPTPHLLSMGATVVSRRRFLATLAQARDCVTTWDALGAG